MLQIDEKQDGNWYEFTTFAYRSPDTARFGITITDGVISSVYVKRIDPQNGYPDLCHRDIILSINNIDITQPDPDIHNLAVALFQSTPRDAPVELRVRRFLPMNRYEFVLIQLLPHDTQLGIHVSTKIDGQGFRISSIMAGGAVHRTHRLIEGDHILELRYSANDTTKVDLRWMNDDEAIKMVHRAYKHNEIILLVKHEYSLAQSA